MANESQHGVRFSAGKCGVSIHASARAGCPFKLRLTVGKLGRTSIRYDYQVFDAVGESAIEGTMTLVVLQSGKPAEIPTTLRAALASDIAYKEE